MTTWTVDVWHSTTFPVGPEPDDWRRYLISADDATEAELIACQMTCAHTGWTACGVGGGGGGRMREWLPSWNVYPNGCF